MDAYISFVLQNASRLISNIDRRQQSSTYGCADRNYWHYKIVDFPCAMLQETCLTLAQLYSIDFMGNVYYHKEVVYDLVLAIIEYWSKIQKADGSFDEFFPNEHSFSPTAFNLYAVCRAYQILNLDEPRIIRQARKSAQFLLQYGDCGASNQEVAAIAGVYCYYLISDDDSVLRGLDALLEKVLGAQSSEGWMPEYQGPDIGYQSIALGYLTDYYVMSRDERVRHPIDRMIEFLSYFVHPDGSVGGEYGSRFTSFLAPHGFELNSETNPIARRIVREVFLRDDHKVNCALDDRYICHFIFPSYLSCIANYVSSGSEEAVPHEKIFTKYFHDSKIYIKSTAKYYFICNLQKGGCLRIYFKTAGVAFDSGYVLLRKNILAINNWIDFNNSIEVLDNHLKVEGVFHKMMSRTPSPLWHVLLRATTFLLGKRVLPYLKKHFILRKNPIDVRFKREINIEAEVVRVNDCISSASGDPFDLYESDTLTYRYVAPTNYFDEIELIEKQSGSKLVGHSIRKISLEKSFHDKSSGTINRVLR